MVLCRGRDVRVWRVRVCMRQAAIICLFCEQERRQVVVLVGRGMNELVVVDQPTGVEH
jgi:hypothetical protein